MPLGAIVTRGVERPGPAKLSEVAWQYRYSVSRSTNGSSEMTTMQDRESVLVEEASDEDLRCARESALASAGTSMEELTRQAATGRFESIRARLAWIVLSGIPQV